jgi:hypothetical protein
VVVEEEEVVVVVAAVPIVLASSPLASPVFLPHLSLHFINCVCHLLQHLHLSGNH